MIGGHNVSRDSEDMKLKVIVLDTGLAPDEFKPKFIKRLSAKGHNIDWPDTDSDCTLDPVAGHGTFIAGPDLMRIPNFGAVINLCPPLPPQ